MLIVHRTKHTNLAAKLKKKTFQSIDNTHSYFTRSNSKDNFDVKYYRTKIKGAKLGINYMKTGVIKYQ